jgi:hypothetical protein
VRSPSSFAKANAFATTRRAVGDEVSQNAYRFGFPSQQSMMRTHRCRGGATGASDGRRVRVSVTDGATAGRCARAVTPDAAAKRMLEIASTTEPDPHGVGDAREGSGSCVMTGAGSSVVRNGRDARGVSFADANAFARTSLNGQGAGPGLISLQAPRRRCGCGVLGVIILGAALAYGAVRAAG